MVLIVEHREVIPLPSLPDPGPRSTERALRHMHWFFVPADAGPLLLRRPAPPSSPQTAPEAP